MAYYQPIIDLQSHRVVGLRGVRALAASERGLVPPSHFVPLARSWDSSVRSTRFVLQHGLPPGTASGRRPEPWAIRSSTIGVNLSARQLADPTLSDRIAAALTQSSIDPKSLILEITESDMLTDDAATVRNLAELRTLGVRIALDDFGTGYSTFFHLLTGCRSTS